MSAQPIMEFPPSKTDGLDHKRLLEIFMYRVQQTRDAQNKYFQTRSGSDLSASKTLEKQLDNALTKLLSMGYSVEEIKKTEQAKLF